MNYTSVYYYILVILTLCFYYAMKKEYRWYVLLGGSMVFLFAVSGTSISRISLFLLSVLLSWYFGKQIETKKEKTYLIAGIALSVLPLLAMKLTDFSGLYLHRSFGILYPIGISFYTMQMIAYLADIYRGKIHAQSSLLKYALFISWFPQLIQGPIPRYEQLSDQLYEGHDYDTNSFMKGIQLIIWGFFLKLMIADKAAVYVNSVFGSSNAYAGLPVWLAGILYSIQLYTDFLACTTLSQGVSQLFGIRLINNFDHPYFSASIREFWRRWHISLSNWLKDYIYIPLGGSRKGKIRTYINLVIVFLVSGIWHGTGLTFLCWGLMHAMYQIIGGLTSEFRNRCYEKAGIGYRGKAMIQRTVTFFLVMTGWIVFRASSLKTAVKMILSLFSWNLWTLTDGTLVQMGLDFREWIVLACSVVVLICVECIQQKHIVVRDWFQKQNTVVRWTVYFLAIWCVFLMGTYGYGFDTADFIYGGF